MKVDDLSFIHAFMYSCEDGWKQNWHERNGGNLSYRLNEEEIRQVMCLNKTLPGVWTPIGVSVPLLAGQWYLVTGSGKYFRHVMHDPANCLAIIEIDGKGENYRIRWGLEGGGRPTSELPSHLMNHEVKQRIGQTDCRVIYHSHPANTIALSFLLPPDDEVFTKTLWGMISECVIVFPDGVGVLPWMVPGSREIAEATSELMAKYDVVIWCQHGIFCAGKDLDTAFGLTHTVEKAAEIFIKVRSAGGDTAQAITMENIHRLESAFLVKAQDDFGHNQIRNIHSEDEGYSFRKANKEE